MPIKHPERTSSYTTSLQRCCCLQAVEKLQEGQTCTIPSKTNSIWKKHLSSINTVVMNLKAAHHDSTLHTFNEHSTWSRTSENCLSLLSSTKFSQDISSIHFDGLGGQALRSNEAPPLKLNVRLLAFLFLL